MVERRDLRRPGHRAAGEGRLEQLRQADVLAQPSLDRRDEVHDARELVLGHQLGPADAARLAHAREVVALEVDDHHVLGGVLLGAASSSVGAERARALDRLRPDPRPAPREESSGEAETIVQPSPVNGRGCERPQRSERRGHAGRIAVEGRREVLDEVDLVDVAGRDRLPHRLDGGRVGTIVRRPLPVADVVRACPRQRARPRVARAPPQAAAGTAPGGRDRVAAESPREPVAEVEVGNESVRAAFEEPLARSSRSTSAMERRAFTE